MEVKKLFKDQSGDSALLKNLNKELYLESREHKRMEGALQEIEDCYRDLLEHTKALLYINDLQGQFLSVNQEAVELLGYDKDSFLKMNIRDILMPEVKHEFEAYLNEIKGHGVAKGVMLVQTAMGEKRLLEYHNTLRTEGVTSPIVRGIAYDITERIQAEKAVKRLSQENAIVAEIGRIISSSLNFEEVYELFTEEVKKLIPFDRIAINLINPKDHTTTIAYVIGADVTGRQMGNVIPLAGTATEEVTRTRSSLLIQAEDPKEITGRYPGLLTSFQSGFRSLMSVPLVSKDEVIGVLHFRSTKPNAYSERELKLAEKVAFQIASAIANAKLFTELKQADEEIQRSYDTQSVINSLLRLSLEDIPFQEILKHALDLILPIPWLVFESRGSIFIIEDKLDVLIMKAQRGLAEPIQKSCATVPFGKCLCGRAALRREIQFSACLNESHETSYEGIIPHGHYCVPILFADKILGVINIYVKEGHQRHQKEEEFLTAVANTLAGIMIRKRGEEALLRAAQQWRTTFDSINDFVSLLDLEGRILRCNKAMKNFVGKPFNEIINHSCWEIMLGTTTPVKDCPFLRAKETLQRETTTYSINDRWFNIAIDPILNETGIFIGAVNTISDITEKKHTEEILRSSEDKYRTILENIEDGYFEVDIAGNFTFINDSLCRIYGYSREELMGMNDRQYTDQQNAKKLFRAFNKVYRTGESTKEIDWEIIRKDGTKKNIEASVSIMKDPSGNRIGFRGLVRDITDRKQAEKEIASLQDQLRQSQKMEAIGHLAGGVAHDFNNLLTVITGYTDLLLRSLAPDSPLYPDTLEIKKASEKAESLTRQLLAFSRKQVIQPKVLNLNTLVSNMDKMLRRLIGEHIEPVTYLAENLGRTKVDPGQIEQVIINLAVNARDAMPGGGRLTIETANMELDEEYARTHIDVKPGPYVMLSVSDTGCGMSPEIKEHIFEPFFTTKGEGRGTGLGLSTVYGIIKQMGGSIWVYSEPGQGTTFKIYLSRVEEDFDLIEPEGNLLGSLQGFETILLAEDEEAVRRVAGAILKRNGYIVLETASGEEALCLVQEGNSNPIHLLLTDVVMPGMNGPGLAKHLTLLQPAMKILYMSGHTDNAVIHQDILEIGAPYIQKPFTPDGLSRKVREVLDGR